MNRERLHLGCCVSGHGYGHAARASAVIAALARTGPLTCTLLSDVDPRFFAASLPGIELVQHRVRTDIGLIQRSSLHADLAATVRALADFYPLAEGRVVQAATLLAGSELVLCDIAPLGILAARRLGIPALLVENFTWDWIYRGYLERAPEVAGCIDYLAAVFALADYRLQARPVCCPVPGGIRIPVIARQVRTDPVVVREKLGLGAGRKLVLVSMGGIGGDRYQTRPLAQRSDCLFVLAGQGGGRMADNIIGLDNHCSWYHPDLVAAADAIIGKVGYSTLAEARIGKTPFGYIARADFPESRVLADYLEEHGLGLAIDEDTFTSGDWLDRLDPLFGLQVTPGDENGAEVAAGIIREIAAGPK